ncbi:MAG TPA: glycosyltransferase family 4 protein [Candidatus Dormibacteraeota bacterium]|nr:glycosyltransferase family 4 protein [Candidatus Dormibacteraeota bacterium]
MADVAIPSPVSVERSQATSGSRPLRVAWFGHAEGRRADGLSTYTREMVAALRRRGAEVRTFVHEGDAAADDESDHDVQLKAVRFRTLTVSLLGSADRIAAALDEFSPDAVHVSWSFGTLDGEIGRMARQRGAATVATFHLPYAVGSVRAAVMRRLYRFHVRNLLEFDRCVALSEDQRTLLIEAGYPADRIVVIHNGVDTVAYAPGPSRLREELGARFVIAYMGRLDPEKRVPHLVRAFLDLDLGPDVALVIAGGGTQERRVRRLAEGHPTVHVLGVVTDADRRLEILRGADVYVLPSTAEGLALSLLEAMSAGCAVVATDAGEDGEALRDAGVLLPVQPLQPGLGEALRQLHDDADLRADLGRRARRRVEERYGLDANVDRLLGVYAALDAPLAVVG